MTDYIERQAALDALGELPLVWAEDDYYSLGARNQYDGDRLAIETIPSADVEPVVRCKDCHFFEADHWETVSEVPLIVAHNICTRWGRGCQTAEDGFCFMAIRSQDVREDGEQDGRA